MFRKLTMVPLLLATGLAFAQDPASVDGYGYDPAMVSDQGFSYAAPNYEQGGDPGLGGLGIPGQFAPSAVGEQMSGVQAVESLLKQVSEQANAPSSSDPSETFAVTQKLKYDAQQLVREHWNDLSPRTREQYRRVYGYDNNPGVSASDSLTRLLFQAADGSVAEGGLLNGMREAQRTTQNLEDLLLPMLQDLKRSFDAGLERAMRN
ncbi:MAG: hypothetical protein E6Q88_10050 [Lysobacteraceae bacterium]|nr:MAG: hypothetical protein E6Q88_10050 [Xanthomonadaceae bacterium]